MFLKYNVFEYLASSLILKFTKERFFMVFHYLLYALNFVNSNCPLLRFDGKVALLSVWQLFSADLSATYKH